MDKDHEGPMFLSNEAWLRLGDWLNEHEAFARLLGIMPNAFTGTITEVELVGFLGGQCDVWPEHMMLAILAAHLTP